MNDLRLRCSLLVRMGVAVGVLATLSIVVALIGGLCGGLLGLAVWDWIATGLEAVASFPGISDVVGVSAPVAALLAALALVVVINWWPLLTRYTPVEHLFQPTAASLVATAAVLGCLYLAVVEGSAAVTSAIVAVLSPIQRVLLGLGLSGPLVVVLLVAGARREVRDLRAQLVDDSVPAAEADPELEATVRRLAQLASVPAPDVYVTDADRPESFTLGSGDSAVVVVSTGLCERLADDELEAVLAHEVSHLANLDSRIVAAAIVPVIIADAWIDPDASDPGDLFWNAVFRALKRYGQFGVAVLSRGREWHADAGAAALASPAALASALETLTDARQVPETDLREWEGAMVALDILPPALEEQGTGPFRTHPSTAARIRRLQRLAAES
ncbi:M48 family metallopeptidase [Halopiger aswanensis]|uniref:Heat shock protein HtpX n=1 Tax=Halopiger aswanensis TaxID=148449 RepID=A0A419WJF3_9EURY|nr:M48 family metalloprotease [Halopiger aswanensis]RKD95492.1 heat shock protein HtpX [Halopiger aswanensis]